MPTRGFRAAIAVHMMRQSYVSSMVNLGSLSGNHFRAACGAKRARRFRFGCGDIGDFGDDPASRRSKTKQKYYCFRRTAQKHKKRASGRACVSPYKCMSHLQMYS
jgi:hypothetical protein